MDLHRWMILLLKAGIAILLVITICDAGSKQSRRTPAHKLAEQTGAAHYEERYEIIPERSSHRLRKRASDEDVDYEVYQGVVGRPGIDFPILPRIPQTKFSCRKIGNGYFADLETDCQVFHICEEGRKISFLCPNGTIFQQAELTCDWWFKVNCASSPVHYAESSETLIRAQNRNKQKTPAPKNEFYSSESDYSRERINHKNSFSAKSVKANDNSDRRRNQGNANRNKKRFDSDEIPSVESIDFDDVSSNSASQEHVRNNYAKVRLGSASEERKPPTNSRKTTERRRVNDNRSDKTVSRLDSSDEMQEPAESTFFGSGNRNSAKSNRFNDVKDDGYAYGKPQVDNNGYIYENPSKSSRKNSEREGKQKTNGNRHQNNYDSEQNRRTSKPRATTASPAIEDRFSKEFEDRSVERPKSNQNKVISSNAVLNKAEKRPSTGAPSKFLIDLSYNSEDEGKAETVKQKPFYTPTVPTILSKTTAKQIVHNKPQPATEKHAYRATTTTTRKPAVSYNVFNLQTKTTTDSAASTESATEFTTRSFNEFGNGNRKTSKTNLSQTNQIRSEKQESNSNLSQRNSKGRIFSTTTEYPEATTFSGKRLNLPKFTTSTEESSTFRSTFAPKEYTTYRTSSAGPTYLPTSTPRPSSAGPTYLPTTTVRTSSAGPTYLPTTTLRPSTLRPTYTPRETTTFRVSTNGATYLPTTPYPTSTGGPTYLPKETTTFRTSSAGPTYLPKEEITTYRPASSSSGPTYLPTTTFRPSTMGATYLPTVATPRDDSVSDHVKNMIRTINDLKNDLNVDTQLLNEEANKFLDKPSRPGLEIPPSSGPETLVSLASYFAGEELANISLASRFTSTEPVNVKSNINIDSGLLSNRTVTNYESLFGLKKPTEPTYLPDILSPEFKTRDSNDLEAQHSSGLLGDIIGKPETRKIAQVFTNALSAYLEDPDSFKQVLSEVRPTEPPIELEAAGAPASYRKPSATLKPEFNRGTGATYLPKPKTTTLAPPTATTSRDDFEVLDFSDATTKNQNRAKLRPTTEYNLGPVTSNAVKNKPVSRFSFGVSSSEENKNKKIDLIGTTTEPSDIAAEINKELKLSTMRPIPLSYDLVAPEINTASTTSQPESSTILTNNLLAPLGPITDFEKSFISSLSAELLPPGISDDDEDTLQRAQSQSFIASRNDFNKENKANRNGKANNDKLHSEPLINRNRSGSSRSRVPTTIPTTVQPTTESPWTKITQSVYLDPLTINAGLMEKRTTTLSPFTYLPKSTTLPTLTSTDVSPTYISLVGGSGGTDRKEAAPIVKSRTSKSFAETSNLSSELLPPSDGMQKIALQMFGGLNDTAANHLMNVMKKAETNSMARRLILLLIQTCDEDYSKTVEQSRTALLNALIGMDNGYTFDDEVEVIKLKPRRQKSINAANRSANLIRTTTSKIPVTTYRRAADTTTTRKPIYTTTTVSPFTATTTDSISVSTTTYKPEQVTRFEIRVEDPDESATSTTTSSSLDGQTTTNLPETSTTYSRNGRRTTTQISYTTTDAPQTTTTAPTTVSTTKSNNVRNSRTQFRINETTAKTATDRTTANAKQSSKRKAKDIDSSLGDANSHKNSDERALELLKSLYSIASKFGRR